jgi:hypothetical protein
MLKPNALRCSAALLALLALPLSGQQSDHAPTAPSLPSHETLEYDVEWRLVNAGRAKLDWHPSPIVKGGWEAKLHLESTGLVTRLFRVNDDYTAEMTNNLCATATYMTAREGSRSRDTKVTFDPVTRKAEYLERDLKTNTVIRKAVDIPACVHEIIGGLYALRAINLEPGKTTQIPVSNGKKTANLRVESQRREDIKLREGKKSTIRYEIFAFNGQLYDRSGHLHVWLTDDARRLPVQIEVRLQFTIGTITLKLNKETYS